jgi:hypothetical protein
MTLCVDAAEVTNRWKRLKKTFAPIAPNGHVEAFVSTTATQVVAALGRDRYARELRQLRHPCVVPKIFINYFEIWRGHTQPQQFILDKAYFHLDTPLGDGRASEEILAIHCDALAKEGEVAFNYKRGPHLHVSGNKRDISKAHIALCLSDLDRTSTDINVYWNAFSGIIKMVGDEILPQLARA